MLDKKEKSKNMCKVQIFQDSNLLLDNNHMTIVKLIKTVLLLHDSR